MSDFGSTKDYYNSKLSKTTPRSSALVFLWCKVGLQKQRTKSDTASITSDRTSASKALPNERSLPYLHPDHLVGEPDRIFGIGHSPVGSSPRPIQKAKPQDDFAVIDSHSAASNASLDGYMRTEQRDTYTMADRTRPTAHGIPVEDRSERRPRGSRNGDTNTISTIVVEPSLFEACRELKRNGVKCSFSSLLTLPNSNAAPSGSQGARSNIGLLDRDRDVNRTIVSSYPEHLFNLPPEPSYLDMCLKTAMLAGFAVEFTPRSSTSSKESTTCEDCNMVFHEEEEFEKHISKEKSGCPFCDRRFNCHGILLRHSCNRG
jgi:hypothetical protein